MQIIITEPYNKSQMLFVKNKWTECFCEHVGQDDGGSTCFVHHNCTISDCTHMDSDNEGGADYED